MAVASVGELGVCSALSDGCSSNAGELLALLEAREAKLLAKGIRVDTWPGVGRATKLGWAAAGAWAGELGLSTAGIATSFDITRSLRASGVAGEATRAAGSSGSGRGPARPAACMAVTATDEPELSSALTDGCSSNSGGLLALLEARKATGLTSDTIVGGWSEGGWVSTIGSGDGAGRVVLAAMSDTNIDANASDRMLPLWASGKS